ncbi:MAG: Peptidoglycan glycosyltransferase, partial [candidate division WS6 bacterium GW2011_GWA2_37_6]
MIRRGNQPQNFDRSQIVAWIVVASFILISLRLFFWQIIESPWAKSEIENQLERSISKQGARGAIFTSDGYLLAGNQTVYQLMADRSIEINPETTLSGLAPYLPQLFPAVAQASTAANLKNSLQAANGAILLAWKSGESSRIGLPITREIYDAYKQQPVTGVRVIAHEQRFYPEASVAAHILGFLGKNEAGEATGYFGIEGALNQELTGKISKQTVWTDAFGGLLAGHTLVESDSLQGRDVYLTLRRDMQALAELYVKQGIEKYGAISAEIIILQPKTGKILALAASPSYNPQQFSQFSTSVYKNPAVTQTFEPGSTFKALTVAAGLDAKVISPDTECPNCAGPRVIEGYTIRTWNDAYTPRITIQRALEQSNNVAMIYVAEKLGKDRFSSYLKKFGIGEPTHLELQEDTQTPFPTNWGPIELATASFGQGISTTSLQLVRAIGAISTAGKRMRLRIVEKVVDHRLNTEMVTEPTVEAQVISPEAAHEAVQMLVSAATHGEAQWTTAKHYTVAGKTGTSQIPIKGGYDEDRTIASFVGFAPPNDPEFLMLVKLNEPKS